MKYLGEIAPLAVIVIVVVIGFVKNTAIFQSFTEGAKNGITTAVNLLPTLIGIIIAVTMLDASGALDKLTELITPIAEKINFPPELVPLALIKPVSGSGATGIVSNLFEKFGTDSEIGMIASTMMASTETTIYAVTVYFSVKSYKSLRYTIPVALLGDFFTIILSVIVVRLL